MTRKWKKIRYFVRNGGTATVIVPVDNNDWSIAIFIAASVHIYNEIEYICDRRHFGPAGTMQHPHIQFVIVLYWLYDKVAAYVVAFVHFWQEFHTEMVGRDVQRIIGPELWVCLLIMEEWNCFSQMYCFYAKFVYRRLYTPFHLMKTATQWSVHCDPTPFAKSPLSLLLVGVGW